MNSQFAGAELDLDLKTGAVTPIGGDSTLYTTQQLNPDAVFRQVNEGFFYDNWPFVDGRKCSSEVSDAYKPATNPTCTLVMTE